jgi:hypothetical protein
LAHTPCDQKPSGGFRKTQRVSTFHAWRSPSRESLCQQGLDSSQIRSNMRSCETPAGQENTMAGCRNLGYQNEGLITNLITPLCAFFLNGRARTQGSESPRCARHAAIRKSQRVGMIARAGPLIPPFCLQRIRPSRAVAGGALRRLQRIRPSRAVAGGVPALRLAARVNPIAVLRRNRACAARGIANRVRSSPSRISQNEFVIAVPEVPATRHGVFLASRRPAGAHTAPEFRVY